MSLSVREMVESAYAGTFETELVEEICHVAQAVEVNDNTVLLDVGSSIESLPLLAKGRIKMLSNDEHGNELFLYYLHPGETCSMSMSSADKQASMVKAASEGATQFISIPIKYVNEWSEKYSSWKSFALNTYESCFERMVKAIDDVAFKQMDERLENYLQEKSSEYKNKNINITHKEIADDLNSKREVISRLLKELERRGVIKLSRSHIELLN